MQLAALRRTLDEQLAPADAREALSVLAALAEGAASLLGPELVGVYLVGSLALGWGDECSDLDVLVVSSGALSARQEAEAGALHADLHDRPEAWAKQVEGSWTTAAAVHDPVGAHPPWLQVDRGSRTMSPSRHDDTWNLRWVLRDSGVPVTGRPAAGLLPPVPAAALKAEAVERADAIAERVLADPDVLDDGREQPHVVLSFCALLWTAATGTVTSKLEAAEWARTLVVPARFRPLLSASVGYRSRPFDPVSNLSDPVLVPITEDFVSWARAEVRRRAGA